MPTRMPTVTPTQSSELSGATKFNAEQASDLTRKYPWLSNAEIQEMLAEAADEEGAED